MTDLARFRLPVSEEIALRQRVIDLEALLQLAHGLLSDREHWFDTRAGRAKLRADIEAALREATEQ